MKVWNNLIIINSDGFYLISLKGTFARLSASNFTPENQGP